MISVVKICSRCRAEKDISDFGKRSDRPDGLQYFCKQCARRAVAEIRTSDPERARLLDVKYRTENKTAFAARQKRYRETHREQQRQRTSRWRAANPHIAKEQDHRRRALIGADKKRVSSAEIKKMLSGACIYCGAKAEQIDHVVPLSRGGRHSIGNLAPACGFCNRSKGASFIVEWKRRQKL